MARTTQAEEAFGVTHRPVEDERARRERPPFSRFLALGFVVAALLVDVVAAVLVIVYAVVH